MGSVVTSNWFLATAIMALVYLFVGYCVASVGGPWSHQRLVLNPLKIVAGSHRVASWSTLQVSFFTYIVLWLSIYWLLKYKGLVELQGDLAILLGIAGVGTVAGKATDNSRSRLSQVNFSWLKNKKWIEKDLIKGKFDNRKPQLCDLITTDGKFDVSRFQAVGFTSVIGVALLLEGIGIAIDDSSGAFSFSIGQTYLALIGVSQGIYVGGKFSQKDTMKQLDQKLDQVRKQEQEFKKSVSCHPDWKQESSSLQEQSQQLFELARKCAQTQYTEFLNVAEEAAGIVGKLSGNPVRQSAMKPSLPPQY